MADIPKRFLGDGVYAAWDRRRIVLTTSDGVCTTNEIFLEPEVVDAFLEFIHRVRLETEREAKRN